MSTDWRVGFGKFTLAIAFSGITVPCWESMVWAQQIIPDETLGAESSVVKPDTIKGMESDRISGGAVRGSNLFHSFREFNIGEGKGGYFENPAAIENIFSRVTGSNPSEILGTLGVLGNANLFFLNPNGIIFGQNASLDLRGSFVGTTADSIVFPDGKQFSATNPSVPPLLTVNVQQPIGLRFEGQSRIITNAADLAVASRQTSNENETNLAVNPEQSLALIGGNVTIDGAEIISPGSNIILGGLNQAGIVNINPDLSLSFPQGINKGNVSLINSTVLDVAGNDGGSININAQNIDINDSQVLAGIREGNGFNNAQAGDIRLDVTETLEVENSFIFNNVNLNAWGNSGRILVNAQDVVINDSVVANIIVGRGNSGGIIIDAEGITLDGELSNGFPSSILSRVNPDAVGKSGEILINVSTLSLTNGGEISAATFGQGDAGTVQVIASEGITLDGERSNGVPSRILSGVASGAVGRSGGIIIDTSTLSLTNGGEIFANTFGEGDAGAVQVTASEGITLDGEASDGFPSRIFSQVESGAVGRSGGIIIDTTTLSLNNGGIISATTFGEGDAGAVKVTASKGITLDGERSNAFPSGIFNQVEIDAVGNSGGIVIDTTTLSLTNGGQISAITVGEGDAGRVQVSATEGITLDGKTSDGFPSRIFNQVESSAVGNSKRIVIDTTTLSLTNGANISTSNFGKGNAGNIKIIASEQVFLSGTSFSDFLNREIGGILAFTLTTGEAGDITIDTPKLTISESSGIEAFTQGEGKAGDITVKATESLILNTDTKLIVESSDLGTAGDITITTPLLTIGKNAQLSTTATETSTSLKAGDITLNVSELNIAGELGIFAETKSIADAGRLAIQPLDTANLNINFSEEGFISARTTSIGDGGSITITAPETIDIRGKGSITAETSGSGQAGDITITTQNFNLSNQTKISASTSSSGQAGNINITADNFNLREGATVITNTAKSGQAGDIELEIRDNLNLVNSTIAASTQEQSSGNGGSIFIDPQVIPQVVTLNNSQIAVNSQGEGTGGNIDLQAETLTLADRSAINAETLSTDGGNIEITLDENILLRDNSQISASAGTAQAGGNGGNIAIDAPFIIAVPQENSDITANAFAGDGGNIRIDTNGIFGIEFRDKVTPLSDITASSEFGQQGEVEINTNAVDPTRSLNDLPQETIEAEVAQGCQTVGGRSTLEFFDVGRGGLPPTPDDLFSSETVIAEWIPLDLAEDQTLDEVVSESELTTTTPLQLSCHSR